MNELEVTKEQFDTVMDFILDEELKSILLKSFEGTKWQ